MSTSSDRQVTVEPEVADEDGLHASAKCSCGALWFSDAGLDGVGNKVPDDTEGVTLEAWTDTHVCLDEAMLARIRGLANNASETREMLPAIQTKIERLCRTSVKVACASLHGDLAVHDDLTSFERWLGHIREQLDDLDAYLRLDPLPEPHLRLLPGPTSP